MKVLLFSGGVDSTAVAYWKQPDALIFIDYGQKPAKGELRAAKQISAELDIMLDVVSIDARHLGAGDMAGKPSLRGPITEFWPFRNQFLVTIGAMYYARATPLELLIGTVSSDKVHPDGTTKFLTHMNSVLKAQGDVSLTAPAISLSTRQLILKSGVTQNTLGWTFSCHVAEHACGQCRGCLKHFDEFGAR